MFDFTHLTSKITIYNFGKIIYFWLHFSLILKISIFKFGRIMKVKSLCLKWSLYLNTVALQIRNPKQQF